MADVVTGHEEIATFNNNNGVCVCGEDEFVDVEWFNELTFIECVMCRRSYTIVDNTAVPPNKILQTDHSGLVPAEEAPEAMDLIMRDGGSEVEDDWAVAQYEETEEVLYAVDGKYVGGLCYAELSNYENPRLMAVAVFSKERRKGYGTEMVEKWFEQKPESTLRVGGMTRDGKALFESIDIDVV